MAVMRCERVPCSGGDRIIDCLGLGIAEPQPMGTCYLYHTQVNYDTFIANSKDTFSREKMEDNALKMLNIDYSF